jgi:Fe2+ or Zn2+ uptake regulation protein
MKDITKLLKEKGINPSIQRIKIFKCLMGNVDHLTAKDIYRKISKEIPTLSKTTIYNTVKLFADKGILKTIRAKDGEAMYDINLQLHPHFRCKKCDSLFDIRSKEMVIEEKEKREIDGHLIEEKCICYWGICKNCREKEG